MMKRAISGIQNRFGKLLWGKNGDQDGSAMIIALLVMILLMGFVALAVSRTNSETIAASNDEAETKTFEAANASLEVLTRNFNKIFETKLTISSSDITRIQYQVPPVFDNDYNFTQTVTQTQATKDVVMTGEMFQGLYARRDEWQLDSLATDKQNGVQVALRRKFLNNRIPIFQFGIFYDDDLEFHPGPRFDFGGRVHTNGSLFLMAGTGVYFSSKVSAANEVFTDISKNGTSYSNWGENVFIKNASGSYVQLYHNMGSVLASPVNGSAVTTSPLPTAYSNASWPTFQNTFQGNLLAHTKPLQLPIKLNSDIGGLGMDLVEVVKRGKNIGDLWNNGTGTVASPNIVPVTATTVDDKVTASDRYYNKTGIRVSLADSKAKLPGCATTTGTAVTTACGVRLDGDSAGQTAGTIAGTLHGYQPRTMTSGGTLPSNYVATQVNGDRLYSANSKETWIKVETVVYNAATITYDTQDITQDILALGVTEAVQTVGTTFVVTDPNYLLNKIDQFSIIKLQRYLMQGPAIPNTTGASNPNTFISNFTDSGNTYNYVKAGTAGIGSCSSGTGWTIVNGGDYTNGSYIFTGDNFAVTRKVAISGVAQNCVSPFPIEMFDTREGLYNDTQSIFDPKSLTAPGYGANVPWAGVMSMVDIDVANLKLFLDGTFNSNMPTDTPYYTATGHVLRSTDIPQNNGWVFYVSDRRGDYDFDGEYDMEDVYGNNDGLLQDGEDINKNGTLQADYTNEAPRYTGAASNISPDIASVFEHKFYRRGVRLINGTQPPGIYDSTTPANTRGFAAAAETGIYVKGNYNATGIASVGTPTVSTDYLPQGTSSHIPASVTGDAIIILSNNWSDANSFVNPFNLGSRPSTETTMRFAMLAGDTITTLNATPNQGGGDLKMNGGVHNFMRFLENWGTRFNYAGSLINLFNSHNNNAPFKCCNNVYSPPGRNWIFDASFLDVNRLPPGTPYFQNIQMTGFQRVN